VKVNDWAWSRPCADQSAAFSLSTSLKAAAASNGPSDRSPTKKKIHMTPPFFLIKKKKVELFDLMKTR
jgi:hypothetical protein